MNPQQSPTDQKPSEAYLQLSNEKTISLSPQPKKQLLILDLNGTLISRIKGRARAGKARAGRAFYARPHYQAFLNYIFKYFEVMVWSSARRQNVERMCLIFSEPLKLMWDRNHFKLDAQQFNSDTDTVKNLDLVWEHFSGEFDATNTIVVDDTVSKLALQPYNLIHIRTFRHEDIQEGLIDNELLKIITYLDAVRSQSNVANYVRNKPFLSHKYIVPENKELDLAMNYFNRAGKSGKPPQPPKKRLRKRPKKGLERRNDGDDDDSDDDNEVDASIKEKDDWEDDVSVKLEPVEDTDDYISIKLEAEEDEVEEPPRKKSKKAKEKPPRHLRKPRHRKQQKNTNATSNIPIRPQTEKKLKSIQESIRQRKLKEKEKSIKILLQEVKDEL